MIAATLNMHQPSRPPARTLGLCLATFLAWVLLACLTKPAHAETPTTGCTPGPLQVVAPGVWAWPATDQDLHASNQGHIVTNVVVVSQGAAWLIDPGATQTHGEVLRQAIACQIQSPLKGIWNSHPHAENTLGNGAWHANTPVWSTAETQAAMQRRCPSCLQHVLETLGPEISAGTHIRIPEQVWTSGGSWRALNGRDDRWQLRAFSDAHSESDLVWWDAQQRTLIAAGLVYQRRLPELAQGSLRHWIAALDVLLDLQPQVVIGQMVGDVQDILATRRYLCGLNNAVLDALDRGETASQTPLLAQPPYRSWAGYAERQGFNTQRAWRELEGLWMSGAQARCDMR